MTYLLEGFVDNVRVLEVIIRKPVELAAEVSNINAAQGIHLREWQNAWEPRFVVRTAHSTCYGAQLT